MEMMTKMAPEKVFLKRGKPVSIGMGTTGNCNFNCEHCYSKPIRGYELSFEQVTSFLDGKNVVSINYGTGENILNKDFVRIVEWCAERGIKQSLTSNGYSIQKLPDEIMRMFNDVDISLDFAKPDSQDAFRKGTSWEFAHKSMEKCRRLGVEYSIATALMNANYKQIPQLLAKVKEVGCNLRMNVFKRVPKAGITQFELSYDEFWEAMGIIFGAGKLISCSEPIVNAMLGIPPIVKKSPCGIKSLRVHPDGQVVPCVYWSETGLTMDDLKESYEPAFESDAFKVVKIQPEFCKDCEHLDVCGGGCASRRYLRGDINQPDQYCPIFHKKPIPEIDVVWAEDEKDLVHSTYLCTMIFQGR